MRRYRVHEFQEARSEMFDAREYFGIGEPLAMRRDESDREGGEWKEARSEGGSP